MPIDRSWIGRTGEPVVMHVERGKIREFARAIKDDDPLYFDEEYAKREAGGIMPPVTFLQTMTHWDDGGGRVRPARRISSTTSSSSAPPPSRSAGGCAARAARPGRRSPSAT